VHDESYMGWVYAVSPQQARKAIAACANVHLTPSQVARELSKRIKHFRGGRPRSHKERCPCGANTLRRAKRRGFDCCRKAGAKYEA
jgi:hypothetical protein